MLRQNCLRVFKEQVIGTINLEHRKKIFYRAMLRSHSHSLKSHIESTYSHIYKLYFCNVFSVSLNFFLNLRPISIALQSFFLKNITTVSKTCSFLSSVRPSPDLGQYIHLSKTLGYKLSAEQSMFPIKSRSLLNSFLSVHVNWFPRILT